MGRTIFVLAAAIPIIFATSMHVAQAADADTATMNNEFRALTQEKIVIEKKMNKSLAEKHANEAEYDRIDEEWNTLDATVKAQRSAVDSVCNSATSQSECDAVRIPFNQKTDAWAVRFVDLAKKRDALDKREAQRDAAGKALVKRYEEVNTRIDFLRTALIRRGNACLASCARQSSAEAAAQCESSCYDGSRGPNDTATVDLRPKPFSMTPDSSRTPDQAIQDYINSGDKPGPKTLKTTAPPPP